MKLKFEVYEGKRYKVPKFKNEKNDIKSFAKEE